MRGQSRLVAELTETLSFTVGVLLGDGVSGEIF